MEGMAGLDGMTGLIPMVVGAGVVMKITDTMLGPQSQAAKSQKKSSKRRREMKINKNSIQRAAGQQNAQLKKAAKPVKMGSGNSNPASSNIFKTVKKSMKGKKLSY
jgi:hypothetical protein